MMSRAMPWCHLQESTFLVTSMVMLLVGMVVTSRSFPPGSTGHTLFTVVASVVLVAAVAVFMRHRLPVRR
jgi:hypothetical protein